jgi:hypothetical protein
MEKKNKLPEAYVFDTGSKGWKTYNFGLLKMQRRKALVQDKLMTGTANDGEFQEFTSDKKASSFHGGY